MLYEVKFRHDSCLVGNHLIFDYEYLLVALLHEILLAGILFGARPGWPRMRRPSRARSRT